MEFVVSVFRLCDRELRIAFGSGVGIFRFFGFLG